MVPLRTCQRKKMNNIGIPMFNILPMNDIGEHVENSTCKCHPRVIFENGEIIIIHNSFDGREYVENLLKPNKN